MRIQKLFWIIVFLVIFPTSFVYLYLKINFHSNKIRFGLSHQTMEAMVFVAEKRNLFNKNNLEFQLDHYLTEKDALDDGLLNNRVDVVASAITPLLIHYINGNQIRILGVIARSDDEIQIIARKSTGILQLTDINKKKLALQKGSINHYFISTYLGQNGIKEEDINFIFTKSDPLPQILAKKKADAIVAKEPDILESKKILKNDVLIFNPTKLVYQAYVLVARKKFVETHPKQIEKFLKALSEAEKFISENPQMAAGYLTSDPLYSQEIINKQWPTINFQLILDTILTNDIDDQTNWVLSKDLTVIKEMPDLKQLITTKLLKNVKPDAVFLDF